jgi:uncharacterized protein (TIGR03437 family)
MKITDKRYRVGLLSLLLTLFGLTIYAHRRFEQARGVKPSQPPRSAAAAPNGKIMHNRPAKPATAPVEPASAVEPAQSGGSFNLTQSVLPGGGGASAGGFVAVTGSAGQPAVATSGGGAYTVSSGFWQGSALITPSSVASVSAASFTGTELASEMIVAAFGVGLATSLEVGMTIPLPTSLAGTTVKVRDAAGAERLAPLFYVAPTQINYQLPPGTATGAAQITVTSGDGKISTGAIRIVTVAPGLFSANSDGQGVPAAFVLRVKSDGSQITEPVAQLSQGRFVPLPIDLGPETDLVFLVLFGTGIRNRNSLSTVIVKIGGADAQTLFAGTTPGFVGLDQVNVRLSQSLKGRGEVDVALTADGMAANTLRINIK